LQGRNALLGHLADLDSYRREQPAQFPLIKLPPSLEEVGPSQLPWSS